MYPINLITNKIARKELESYLNNPFTEMVKFVVDIEKGILALGGELHSDAELVLLEQGSAQKNLWGGNVYPLKNGDDTLEFSSLINIRPSQNNFSLDIKDKNLQAQIKDIVKKLLL